MMKTKDIQSTALSLAVVVGFILNAQVSTVHAQGGVWVYKTPMTTPSGGVSVAELNGQIYAIGRGGNTLQVYDPVSNSWTTKASKPTRGTSGIGVINGLIYDGGSGWTACGNTINCSNGTNSITITPPTGNLFFRLTK